MRWISPRLTISSSPLTHLLSSMSTLNSWEKASLTGRRTAEERVENDRAMMQMAVQIVSTDTWSTCIKIDTVHSTKNILLYAR